MTYTIGEVAEEFSLPVSTLRYYDKEGLFPGLQRRNGVRLFGEQQIEALRVIECLKKSGLSISDIRQFMRWCEAGSDTYEQRFQLFRQQRDHVEKELQLMLKMKDMLTYKCWYYEQLLAGKNEDDMNDPNIEEMPPHISSAFRNAFW